jgi:hypothetical protein
MKKSILPAAALFLAVTAWAGPVEFGRQQLAAAQQKAGLEQSAADIPVKISPAGGPESYTIRLDGRSAAIKAGDAAGAMYGLLELAERVRLGGAGACARGKITGRPFLRDRGLNVFLTLPWDYQNNCTDDAPEALVDPQRWWFQNDAYWRMLFDSMARHRLNWLDLHGAWDIEVTSAPNLYAYFIQSDLYPEVGVAPEIKARNLQQLNKVIDMAHQRGIRVSLMAYEARLTIPQKPKVPYPNTEAVAYAYTREVVGKMIRQAPHLDAIAYRIGESGKSESFFRCYQEAVQASGRDIPLLTRTWLARKSQILPLAQASDNYSSQIKYDGEQWGPPYFVAGGRMAAWHSYSFENYLSYSGAGPAAKMWPGNRAQGGRPWPSEPYKEVWQVRANGTHRIFPFYEPDWVRRSIEDMKIGTAAGFTVEPLNAYYPDSPRYYTANPQDLYTPWILERDEPYLMLWGRLGYDPGTPDSAFQLWFSDTFGAQGGAIAGAWKTASRIVPTAFNLYSLGPDHRDHNPEMELGGDVEAFIAGEPFDTFSLMSVKESLSWLALGLKDGRAANCAFAGRLTNDAAQIRSAVAAINEAGFSESAAKRWKELRSAMLMLSHLGDYYAGRLESAYWQGLGDQHRGDYSAPAAAALGQSLEAWRQLSDSPQANYYKPFTETLRMHTTRFHWKNELPALKKIVDASPAPAAGSTPPPLSLPSLPPSPPKGAVLTWSARGSDVFCHVPAAGLTRAWLLVKPLPSTTLFHKIPMEKKGSFFQARCRRLNCGLMIAADLEFDGQVARTPNWEQSDPYLIIPSLAGPTPFYYGSDEALSYLKPAVLTPEKFGTLLLPPRSFRFFREYNPETQRKLLDPVSRGMRLVILQQLYGEKGYSLNWLPVPPKIAARNLDNFEPGGALGLPDVSAPGILSQGFLPTEGWDIFGNGGVARFKLGRGEIWLIQARAFQLAHHPDAARLLARIASLDTTRPAVLLDNSGEGASTTSSFLPDLMNAMSAPFLTLGEVIAREQGMDCFKEVAGTINPP